ncbi:hypothetical protein DV735_g5068, partial [Chaetothyriales sp. CBS 134920]
MVMHKFSDGCILRAILSHSEKSYTQEWNVLPAMATRTMTYWISNCLYRRPTFTRCEYTDLTDLSGISAVVQGSTTVSLFFYRREAGARYRSFVSRYDRAYPAQDLIFLFFPIQANEQLQSMAIRRERYLEFPINTPVVQVATTKGRTYTFGPQVQDDRVRGLLFVYECLRPETDGHIVGVSYFIPSGADPALHSSPSRPESEPQDSEADVSKDHQEDVAEEEQAAEDASKHTPVRSDPEAPPLPDEAPPLPDETPPSEEKADDGWQPIWDEAAQAFYFYNRFSHVTQWENPRVPSASQETATDAIASNHDRRAGSASGSVGGYNPAIHGDYDPNADYARAHQATGSGASGAEATAAAAAAAAEAYAATGAFNRFTGRWQGADFTPDRFSDEAKSKRQMHAFFDVDAAANSHDGRSLRAERQQKKLSKKELKAFKEKRREKKEEKRRARAPRRALVLSRPNDLPHVTVIRPCKGDEPYLYECLAAAFQQDYPNSRLSIHLCIESKSDPAYEAITRVVADHPRHHARVFVEHDDPFLRENLDRLGPNPKIRNMSRAYREAQGDIIWILDCNVWVNPGACARMVDKLCGLAKDRPQRPYKLVHHLPISVDVDSTLPPLKGASNPDSKAGGGLLEELFLSSSHAKMYVAINTVAVAPCIVGKSSMFRKSQLDRLTELKSRAPGGPGVSGIDFFSHNICEDHLIGDLLWKSRIPPTETGLKFRNHGLVMGDMAVQPVAGMTVGNYIARRVRWLRVRKFSVPTATAVEPATESLVCSLMGAWGVTTSSYTRHAFGTGWSAMLLWFLLSVVLWALVDRTVYLLLHSGLTLEDPGSSRTPLFARPPKHLIWGHRTFLQWAKPWLGREALALPIWTWAIFGGVTVTWRGRRFRVGLDMRTHEIDETANGTTPVPKPDRLKASNGIPTRGH